MQTLENYYEVIASKHRELYWLGKAGLVEGEIKTITCRAMNMIR
jgi:hypothetical protein